MEEGKRITEKPLIMVVEDETEYAEKIAVAIRNTDKYQVITAYSAKEALESLDQNQVRCIVLDIKMPEMDGLQFLRKIRKDYGSDIGVIVITAWEDEETRKSVSSESVTGYMNKPFEREELLQTIERFFKSEKS